MYYTLDYIDHYDTDNMSFSRPLLRNRPSLYTIAGGEAPAHTQKMISHNTENRITPESSTLTVQCT